MDNKEQEEEWGPGGVGGSNLTETAGYRSNRELVGEHLMTITTMKE